MAPGPRRDLASMLLAHTAELKLSDQQVTRLAAIARRAEERRQAERRTMDSLSSRGPRPDSLRGGLIGPSPAMRAQLERLRAEHHADVRETLGVLTLDQQASAWERMW